MISVGPIGTTNSSGLSHPHQHRRHLPMPRVKRVQQCCRCTCHRRPTTTTYPPSDNDDDDFDDELADLRAKHARRLATQARYRARYPDRIAAARKRYREQRRRKTKSPDNDDLRARRRATQARYRARHPDVIAPRKNSGMTPETIKKIEPRVGSSHHESRAGKIIK